MSELLSAHQAAVEGQRIRIADSNIADMLTPLAASQC